MAAPLRLEQAGPAVIQPTDRAAGASAVTLRAQESEVASKAHKSWAVAFGALTSIVCMKKYLDRNHK